MKTPALVSYLLTDQPLLGFGEIFTSQIYVEKIVPETITQEHPLVFIPGAGQTGTVSEVLIHCT